ncbi:MAG: phage tail protein [Cohaesibacter sp.]|jgi:phage tail P2-like protein|nr:phage tail protein [Cohaesibacter sp.]
MAKRDFPQTLIPPGINDERSRSFLKLFSAMAEEFDFSSLLMRNSSEMKDDVLELAVHDFSLDEFIGPDGVPPIVARRLIDRAWELHEKQGRDEGVVAGQNVLGSSVAIEHWWQQDPKGPHDTQKVTIFFDEPLFEDSQLGDEKYRQAALKVIDATKRWSQDTALRFGTQTEVTHYLGVISSSAARYVAMLPADDPAPIPSKQFIAAASSAGGVFTAGFEV